MKDDVFSKIVVVDLETSGLDPRAHGILEIGAVKMATDECFELAVRLEPNVTYDPGVFRVNGIGEAVARCPSRACEAEALQSFFAWLGKGPWRIAGSNPKFDHDFLQVTNFEIHELPWPFGRHLVDLQTAALTHLLANKMEVPKSLSADALYPLLGMVPEPKPHRALQGAQWEAEAFRRIWKLSPSTLERTNP